MTHVEYLEKELETYKKKKELFSEEAKSTKAFLMELSLL